METVRTALLLFQENLIRDLKLTQKQIDDSWGKPHVVHLKRKNGKVIQNCDIYIGRQCNMGGWNLNSSKWANPFTVKECGTVEVAIEKYRDYVL